MVIVPLIVAVLVDRSVPRADALGGARRARKPGRALSALSLTKPMQRDKAFESVNYVSQFARSGVLAVVDLSTRGLLESDAIVRERPAGDRAGGCTPTQRLPHIVMVLDEFELRHQRRAGRQGSARTTRAISARSTARTRSLLVEGAGGPTWYTEYNVLSGLSARSFGHFAEFVTRIAAGRVTRSLPNALRPCGYRSFSVYPWLGAFLSARGFQKTLGIDHFLDAKDLKSPRGRARRILLRLRRRPDRARKRATGRCSC